MHPENGVADFLAQRLEKREEERRRLEDRNALTNRANLGYLLVTWRFILVTRAAFFALAWAGLSYILQNITSFLDTTRIIPVFETIFGRQTAVLETVRLITSAQAAYLVAAVIVSIALCAFAIDVMLSRLQGRCVKIGARSEEELEVHGLFSAVEGYRRLIGLPFFIARYAMLTVGLIALWYLATS